MFLRDYMEKHALSSRDVARRGGIGYVTICNYLNGLSSPTVRTAQAIVDATNKQVSFREICQEFEMILQEKMTGRFVSRRGKRIKKTLQNQMQIEI